MNEVLRKCGFGSIEEVRNALQGKATKVAEPSETQVPEPEKKEQEKPTKKTNSTKPAPKPKKAKKVEVVEISDPCVKINKATQVQAGDIVRVTVKGRGYIPLKEVPKNFKAGDLGNGTHILYVEVYNSILWLVDRHKRYGNHVNRFLEFQNCPPDSLAGSVILEKILTTP